MGAMPQTTAPNQRRRHARPLASAVLPRTITTRAFAFTDIVASSELADRLGDRRFAELIRTHNALVRRLLPQHHGREACFLGDGFLLVFDTPADALSFGIALQREAARRLPERM